jgi:hypothetical protein
MGEWIDSNGQHNYIGDSSGVDIEDAPYTDIKRFLSTHGFRSLETSPMGQTSEETFQARDGRKITLGLKDTGIGIPEIDNAHYNDVGTGQNTGPVQTLEDLTDFVVYAKYPKSSSAESPNDGGHEVTQSDKIPSETTIKDEAGYKATVTDIIKAQREWISKPMGQYSSWDDCKKAGKTDAYCGYLYHHASPHGHGKSLDQRTIVFKFARKFLVGPNSQGTSSTSGIGTNSQSADGGQVRSEQPVSGPGQNTLAGGAVRQDAPQPQQTGMPQQPPPPPKPGEAPPGSPAVPDDSKDHANMAYSLGNKPVAAAQQHLESQGYQLTGTTAKIGEDLVHTYAHPNGHTIAVSSSDGKNVSGIEYKIPTPPKQQKPQQNVFASQPQAQAQTPPAQPGQPKSPVQAKPQSPAQPQQQPQQAPPKQDMPAYPGGAASVTGQGRAEEGGPGSGRHRGSGHGDWLHGPTGSKITTVPQTTIPSTALPGDTVPKFDAQRSYNKGIVLGPGETIGGAGVFCDICHTATGKYVHYKGLIACPSCASRTYGVSRTPMSKGGPGSGRRRTAHPCTCEPGTDEGGDTSSATSRCSCGYSKDSHEHCNTCGGIAGVR